MPLLLLCMLTACQAVPPAAGASRVSAVDGATLIFVPEGEFTMGSIDGAAGADTDELPQHLIYVSAFWIDRTEVTNAMYAGCVQAGACTAPAHSRDYGVEAYVHHPVLGVSWDQAVQYCAWVERRLPTEAEWEKAARGTDARLYPWGDEAPDASLLNFDHMLEDTAVVGSYPAGASPYGVLDMAGNVWEWTADAYDPAFYAASPSEDPLAERPINRRVLRGGSWSTQWHNVRAANRFWGFPGRNDTDGFRCAVSAE